MDNLVFIEEESKLFIVKPVKYYAKIGYNSFGSYIINLETKKVVFYETVYTNSWVQSVILRLTKKWIYFKIYR